MKTISIDTARKLKDAGLVWEPKEGDWFSYGDQNYPSLVHFQTKLTSRQWISVSDETRPEGRLMTMKQLLEENAYWLPALDDLLEWLEEHGYYWELSCFTDGKGIKYHRLTLMVKGEEWHGGQNVFISHKGTSVEAAARSVLWVLEKEANHDNN